MLISCVAYEDGHKIADIPVADISEYVHRPNCFVWVALFEPTLEELDEMGAEFGLHELAAREPQTAEVGDLAADLRDEGLQVDAAVAALEAGLDLGGREMMQDDLHPREFVEIGIEQRRDDHERACPRPHRDARPLP